MKEIMKACAVKGASRTCESGDAFRNRAFGERCSHTAARPAGGRRGERKGGKEGEGLGRVPWR